MLLGTLFALLPTAQIATYVPQCWGGPKDSILDFLLALRVSRLRDVRDVME